MTKQKVIKTTLTKRLIYVLKTFFLFGNIYQACRYFVEIPIGFFGKNHSVKALHLSY